MRTTVALDVRTRDKLLALRRRWGLRSAEAVIERLLAGAPPSARALYAQNRRAVVAVCRRYGVTRLVAFGSRARGDARPDSDLDLAVVLPRNADLLVLASLREDLEAAFGVPTHVVTLDSVRGALKREIATEGVALVA